MTEKTISRALLKVGAVAVSPDEPFTWASGLKSPIYCDNRMMFSTIEERRAIIGGFCDMVKSQFGDVDVLAGTATAGIPWAAMIAYECDLPMIYVRSKPKGHGKQKRVEGILPAGSKVLVIEDLVSTGGSSLDTVTALHEADSKVLGVACIFHYAFEEALTRFKDADMALAALTDLPALLQVAVDDQQLTNDAMDSVNRWRVNPRAWSAERGGA